MLTRDQIIAPPIRNGYYTRNPRLYAYLRARDTFIRLCGMPADRERASRPNSPQRILFANGAHLGDIVIATSVLPALKTAFPNVKVGFLIGSWARPVVADHPLVDWVHTVDHWRLNRSSASLGAKLVRYLRTRIAALNEIKRVNYSAAVELRSSYPNSIGLLWQARIPVRVGYLGGGLGPLLTHPAELRDLCRPAAEHHFDLLSPFGVSQADIANVRSCLAPVDDVARRSIADSLKPHLTSRHFGYVVMHPGAGNSDREWPEDKWRDLAIKLSTEPYLLVFTGQGHRERDRIDAIVTDVPNCVSLCNQLSWTSFVSAISNAQLLIGVESVAAHVAAAVGTPSVAIYSGVNPGHWRPRSPLAHILIAPVPCSPCHWRCAGMECVRNVESQQVYETAQMLLAPAQNRLGTAQ